LSSRLSIDVRGKARVRPAVVRELGRQVRRAMRAAGLDGEVALSLTDDRELRALNRAYAGEDHATDVLSFSQREGEVGVASAAVGDVVISVETAARQALAGGRTLTAELIHLAVHGLAHLQGYDHATKAEERVMFGYEARLREVAAGKGVVSRVRSPSRSR
jgi:probable rRNA maturation factor